MSYQVANPTTPSMPLVTLEFASWLFYHRSHAIAPLPLSCREEVSARKTDRRAWQARHADILLLISSRLFFSRQEASSLVKLVFFICVKYKCPKLYATLTNPTHTNLMLDRRSCFVSFVCSRKTVFYFHTKPRKPI